MQAWLQPGDCCPLTLAISKPSENFPIRFLDSDHNSNLVLDLVFLHLFSSKFNCHHIHPKWRLSSDHTLITIDISIQDKSIPNKQWSLVKESDDEKQFIDDLIQVIKNMNTTSIYDTKSLEEVVQYLASKIENIWFKHSKTVNITRHSKAW